MAAADALLLQCVSTAGNIKKQVTQLVPKSSDMNNNTTAGFTLSLEDIQLREQRKHNHIATSQKEVTATGCLRWLRTDANKSVVFIVHLALLEEGKCCFSGIQNTFFI